MLMATEMKFQPRRRLDSYQQDVEEKRKMKMKEPATISQSQLTVRSTKQKERHVIMMTTKFRS